MGPNDASSVVWAPIPPPPGPISLPVVSFVVYNLQCDKTFVSVSIKKKKKKKRKEKLT